MLFGLICRTIIVKLSYNPNVVRYITQIKVFNYWAERILYISMGAFTPLSLALEPISDQEMANVTGQAFITVDTSSYDDNGTQYEFTKLNLGLVIETLFNMNSVSVGTFDRTAYEDGTMPRTDENGTILVENGEMLVYDSDVYLENFALGRVSNYDSAASSAAIPFKFDTPYFEFAYKLENGERKVAGFRYGFDKAQGDLSGDIISYTGKLEGEVRGKAGVVYDKTYPDGCSFLDLNCYALLAAYNTEIYSELEAVDGSTGNGASNLGEEYLKRVSWFGIRNGNVFQSDEPGLVAAFIPALTTANNCRILTDVEACYASTIYESIYIGEEGESFETGAANGLFVSWQADRVPWEDLSGVPGVDRVVTEIGAYVNIARFQVNGETKYPLYLTLDEGINGSPRVPTCVGQLKGC